MSRDWIAESTRGQTGGIADAPNYGYQWWIRPRGRYLAHGYNGQYIGVDPEADIVMTMITLSEQSPRPQETYRYYFEQLQNLAREAMRPERRGRLLATAVAPEAGSDPGEITIEVRRVNGSDGAVTLAYGTRNGSARAGREFRRLVHVPLMADDEIERSELFDLVLSDVSGGAELPEPRAVGVIQDMTAGPGCTDSDGALCLSGGRFRVEVEWQSHNGERGIGALERLSDETGIATFFSPENVELVFKLLDGRGINDHHWVYYGALSDVEYWLTVTDTLHDRVVVYRNPPGEICGRGDSKAFAELAAVAAVLTAPGPPDISPAPVVETEGDCREGALCLLDGRFEVTAEWTKADGESGVATPLPGAGATGTMWFFSPGNIELAVKALDGRANNNAFWVFAAGLTDVDYQLTVTDTVAGVSKTYSNPSRPFCGLGDTSAFPQ